MTEKSPLTAVIAANVETLEQGIETLVSISCTTWNELRTSILHTPH